MFDRGWVRCQIATVSSYQRGVTELVASGPGMRRTARNPNLGLPTALRGRFVPPAAPGRPLPPRLAGPSPVITAGWRRSAGCSGHHDDMADAGAGEADDDVAGTTQRRDARVAAVALGLAIVLVLAVIVLTGGDPRRPLPDSALDRTWVAVERSDGPARAVAPMFTAGAGDDGVVLSGSDGCTPTVIELIGTTGVVDEVVVIEEPAEPCPDGGTPFTWRPGDEIDTGDDDLLVVRDGATVARFVALDSLPPARTADLEGRWMLDRGVGFESRATPIGMQLELRVLCADETGRLPTAPPTWSSDDGRLATEGLPTDECEVPDRLTPFADTTAVGLMLAEQEEVRRFDAALVLTHPGNALVLRPLPAGSPDPAGLDVASGTAFGIQPGLGPSPDDALDAVGAVLGDPDFDSGWLGVPAGTPVPCRGADDVYRTLWWGDLSFAFWRTGERTFLESWMLGEPWNWRLVPDVDAAIAPELVEPSGLRTEAGLAIGDAPEGLDGVNVARTDLSDEEVELYTVSSVIGGGTYVVRDGRIVTVTSLPAGC